MDSRKLKCQGKMIFESEKEAQATAVITEYQHGNKLKSYHCRDCKLWHLSSKY